MRQREGGLSGQWTHLDQDSKEEAGAELLHTLGCHAAVVAVVSLLLQGMGLHFWLLPVAWEEGGQGCWWGAGCMNHTG